MATNHDELPAPRLPPGIRKPKPVDKAAAKPKAKPAKPGVPPTQTKGKPTLVESYEHLAEELGVTSATIHRWKGNSKDTPKPDGRGRHNVEAWRSWVLDRHPDGNEQLTLEFQRWRKMRSDADRSEVERDKEKGKLIALADAKSVWSDLVLQFREKMLSLPNRMAPVVAMHGGQQRVIEDLLYREVMLALNSLSQPVEYPNAKAHEVPDDE